MTSMERMKLQMIWRIRLTPLKSQALFLLMKKMSKISLMRKIMIEIITIGIYQIGSSILIRRRMMSCNFSIPGSATGGAADSLHGQAHKRKG